MNNLKKIFTSIVIVLSISSCSNLQSQIEINLETVKSPFIISLAKDNNERIISIQLPKKINIHNNSLSYKTFLRMYYNYNKTIPDERKGGYGMELFMYNNDILNNVQNKKTTIKSKSKLSYIIYSNHYIDSIQSIELIHYAKKMFKENKDTLHINEVNEFKRKHKELFEKLTKNDSISIQFLNGEKLGERITVPVEW